MSTKHDMTLNPVDVAEGRAVVVVCPVCGLLEIWSKAEASLEPGEVDHGIRRTKGRPCWCEEEELSEA